jgi:hypothetical protein
VNDGPLDAEWPTRQLLRLAGMIPIPVAEISDIQPWPDGDHLAFALPVVLFNPKRTGAHYSPASAAPSEETMTGHARARHQL